MTAASAQMTSFANSSDRPLCVAPGRMAVMLPPRKSTRLASRRAWPWCSRLASWALKAWSSCAVNCVEAISMKPAGSNSCVFRDLEGVKEALASCWGGSGCGGGGDGGGASSGSGGGEGGVSASGAGASRASRRNGLELSRSSSDALMTETFRLSGMPSSVPIGSCAPGHLMNVPTAARWKASASSRARYGQRSRLRRISARRNSGSRSALSAYCGGRAPSGTERSATRVNWAGAGPGT